MYSCLCICTCLAIYMYMFMYYARTILFLKYAGENTDISISFLLLYLHFFMIVFQIVVMACKIVEMAKPKCERYWPEVNQSMKIGAIQVTTVSGGREAEREGGRRERERGGGRERNGGREGGREREREKGREREESLQLLLINCSPPPCS